MTYTKDKITIIILGLIVLVSVILRASFYKGTYYYKVYNMFSGAMGFTWLAYCVYFVPVLFIAAGIRYRVWAFI